ncbi:hypothetical protein KQI65_03410 [bacterium]|nr:hypothetical protein [bacterium]
MKTIDARGRFRAHGSHAVTLLLAILIASGTAYAQTEPEAPREPEKLYNGWQFALLGGLNLGYINGEYHGDCNCDFYSDEYSANSYYGMSLNIPLFSDASIYLRLARNQSSTSWAVGRTDSLFSTAGTGTLINDLTFNYDLLQFDVLLRLFGRIDGERVYIGPSFGFVQKKRILLTESEVETGAVRLIEDGPIAVEHDLRMSFVIGAEYAFVPFRNIYVIPAIEVDYAFDKLLRDESTAPAFSWRPTFYRAYVTVAYQMF